VCQKYVVSCLTSGGAKEYSAGRVFAGAVLGSGAAWSHRFDALAAAEILKERSSLFLRSSAFLINSLQRPSPFD
jgi:hypothetical protein